MDNQPIPFTCYRIAGVIYPDGSFTWGPGRAMTIDEASPFLREAVESALRASSLGSNSHNHT